ncbi:MAG TPA: hypothetical protein VGA52_13975 [Anaerolineales bacterium]
MSKKKRKSRPNIPEVTLLRYGSGGASERTTRDEGFDPDYSYVVQDLRRIGMLAAGFILLLLVLSVLLN